MSTLLSAHSGVFAPRQALDLGVTHDELSQAVRRGALVRPRRGVLVDRRVWDAASPRDRYLHTVRGVLEGHPTWAASHHAAAAVHGLPLWGVDLDLVDVVAPVRTTKRRPGLHVHPAVPGTPLHRDSRAVPPAVACVQVAAASGTEQGVVCLDAALHLGMCSVDQIEEALSRGTVRYGLHRARRMLALSDPRCESPGESRTRLILRALGYSVRSQVPVADGNGHVVARVDFLVDGVIVEFDGAVKYEGVDGREALVAEKHREDTLRALGYPVVRLTWADLDQPALIRERVEQARTHAARY